MRQNEPSAKCIGKPESGQRKNIKGEETAGEDNVRGGGGGEGEGRRESSGKCAKRLIDV